MDPNLPGPSLSTDVIAGAILVTESQGYFSIRWNAGRLKPLEIADDRGPSGFHVARKKGGGDIPTGVWFERDYSSYMILISLA